MSLREFQEWLPDEKSAVEYFENVRWCGKILCPFCDSDDILHVTSGKPMPYRCRGCRKHFSVKTGTVMQSSKIPVRTWLTVMYYMSIAKKGMSSCQISRQLGIRQPTVWFLCQRIREGWNQGRFLLDGEVEMDETYIGGKEKNKHLSKKLNSGRGTVGKVPVVGLKQRKGRMYAIVANTPSQQVLHEIIDQRVSPTATLYTDEHSGYVGARVRSHVAVKHSKGQYVRGNASTNGVESFWALLKRGYYGTYHKMSANHLSRYVDEFASRHNANGQTTEQQLRETLSGMVGKTLPYKELVK